MFDELHQLTFPNGKTFDFVELPPHRSGDRLFRVRSRPPKGQVWNLRNVPRLVPIQVGQDLFEKTGGTGTTIRLRPMKGQP